MIALLEPPPVELEPEVEEAVQLESAEPAEPPVETGPSPFTPRW